MDGESVGESSRERLGIGLNGEEVYFALTLFSPSVLRGVAFLSIDTL